MLVDGAKVLSKKNSFSREQLFVRAAWGDLTALQFYLANGGDIDDKDEDGLALIHYAACHGNVPLIRKLREHGADMNLREDGTPPWKPIHYAIFHQKHEAEQVLRALGAEVPLPILKRIAQEKPVFDTDGAWTAKTGSASATWRER